ncbi:hypothetical protein D3C76_434670 [compost metagenome]
MLTQYLNSPRTIKELGKEIRLVCDDYWGRVISEDIALSQIKYWAQNESIKMFQGKELNPTLKIVIGKKRELLLKKFLELAGFLVDN